MTRDLAEAAGRDNYFSLVLLRPSPPTSPAANPESPSPHAGRIWLVGLGPGAEDLLTRRAWRLLHRVDDVVGYAGYLKPLESLRLRARFHATPIGEEAGRASRALGLAREGRQSATARRGGPWRPERFAACVGRHR